MEEAWRRTRARLEVALSRSPVTVFEQDRDLRYTWIHNPALGYEALRVVGLRDSDFLEDAAEAEAIEALKREVIETRQGLRREVAFTRGGALRWYDLTVEPLHGPEGDVAGVTCVAVDVTDRVRAEDERRRAEEALRATNEALREADRQKTELLGALSHELRNPLAPIRNALHLLQHAPADGPQATRALGILRRQTDHLARLVDDLLDVTRVARGEVTLQRATVDLRSLVAGTAEDQRPRFDQRGVRLEVDLPDAPLLVDADAARVAQVLDGLVQNALKFTPPGGAVRLVARAAGTCARVVVRDDGIGIDPLHLARLFEPFAQADRSLARTQGGLGLGLSLARGLIGLHGGTVHATSEGLGRGTELVITLPLAEAAPETAAGPSLRVVVIEDNIDAGDTLADVLELQGHRVRVARDAGGGLELVRSVRPDVVICDIGLPDRSGYEVARAVRQEPELRAVRLIALSGYAQPEDRARALAAGFDVHLAKPPALEALSHALR